MTNTTEARPAVTDSAAIDRREYTYCSAFYPGCVFRKFLVMTPKSAEARERAMAYARERWGEPDALHIYPRNYVRDARVLYAAGKHD